VNEAVMLALRYPTVHLDTSILFSGSPSDAIRQALTTTIGLETLDRSLSRQVLFGSNYPRVDPKRVVRAIDELNLRPALRQRIFRDNAADLLGLGEERA
jgi:uncharacterized protein